MSPPAELFSWLVQYHWKKNLPACLPFVEGGKIISPAGRYKGRVLREGLEENELYSGLLLVSNGESLLDKLSKERIVLDSGENFTPVSSYEQFEQYLEQEEGSDGAYIYDGTNKRITRAYELNNNPSSLAGNEFLYSQLLPADFITHDYSLPLKHENMARFLGTKTRLAVKLPKAHSEIHTFQIKRTAYAPLGMGKVTHFSNQGLKEEFFFKSVPGYEHESNRQIVGVYRRYGQINDKIELLEERIVEPEQHQKSQHDLFSYESGYKSG